MENENSTASVPQEAASAPVPAEQQEIAQTPAAEPEQQEIAPVPAAEPETVRRPPLEPIAVTDEMVEKTKKTLSTMLDYLGLEGTVKAEGKPNKINLLVASEDAGRIIGRKGQSLESLQILINRMMQKGDEPFPKIYIDIDGYSFTSKRGEKHDGDHERRPRGDDRRGGRFSHDRNERPERTGRGDREERRESFGGVKENSDKDEQLRQQALDSAKEVRRWGESVTLPPMNSHDRRIIHITLEKETDLLTESSGEGNFKSVVIALKKEENA